MSSSSGNKSSVLLIENGAGMLKYGLESSNRKAVDGPQGIMPNVCARMSKQMSVLVGDEVENVHNGSSLNYMRPFDRGYLINWGVEIDIWNKVLKNLKCSASDPECLIVTEPIFNPEELQNDYNEVIFEEFGFNSYLRRPSAWFSAYEYMCYPPLPVSAPTSVRTPTPTSCMVIESGFSFSYSIPIINGRILQSACSRVDVGGKLLTNYLKEMVSYRQWNMMDEFKLMDQVKQDLCFVSTDFMRDIKLYQTAYGPGRGHNRNQDLSTTTVGAELKKSFILPDFQTTMTGYVPPNDYEIKPEDQVLAMETERFTVPEVLFNPLDIGMPQAGLPAACWDGLKTGATLVEQGACLPNTILTGGNVQFPNFKQRFDAELRPFIPEDVDYNSYLPENPHHYAFKGMQSFVKNANKSNNLAQSAVSKQEYLEYGHSYTNEKFFMSSYK